MSSGLNLRFVLCATCVCKCKACTDLLLIHRRFVVGALCLSYRIFPGNNVSVFG